MKNLSKAFYISSFLSGSILPGVLVLFGALLGADEGLLIVIGVVPPLYSIYIILRLTYAMWSSIQDDQARMTPGNAVKLLFVPIFNIYWMYQVLIGFVDDYNSFISRNEIETPNLKYNFFGAHFVLNLFLLVPGVGGFVAIINLVVASIMISEICDAVNAVFYAMSRRAEGLLKESVR